MKPYSRQVLRDMFDGHTVSPVLPYKSLDADQMNNSIFQLGQDIKARRNQLGISQQTLADLAEVGINTLVALERGHGNPSLKTLQRIASALGLKIILV